MTYEDAKDWIMENLEDYVPPPPGRLASFDKWIFPVIRNMPQQPLLEELVAVQPMTAPPNFYR